MKAINACLMFDGHCAEAMKFYQKSLNADLKMKAYSDAMGAGTPAPLQGRIMRAILSKGEATLLAADIMPQPGFKIGNNFTISISCESAREVDQYAKALSEGGNVTMPGQEMPWGYFGMLTDKYGIDWMFSYESTKVL